jgi:acyl carrier protein
VERELVDRAEAEDTLRKALAMALGRDNLDILDEGPDGHAIRLSELGVDSLAIMELGITLEYEFGVEINPGSFVLHPQTTYKELSGFFHEAISSQG